MSSSGSPSDNGPILLCADGSEASLEALRAGLELIGTDHPLVLISVKAPPDISAVTGTGFAGGTLTAEAYELEVAAANERANEAVTHARTELGILDAEMVLLEGDAASAICAYAEQQSAHAIVMGTRGRGGLRRAVLGSVADHVVRHAPCTVVVSRDGLAHDD